MRVWQQQHYKLTASELVKLANSINTINQTF